MADYPLLAATPRVIRDLKKIEAIPSVETNGANKTIGVNAQMSKYPFEAFFKVSRVTDTSVKISTGAKVPGYNNLAGFYVAGVDVLPVDGGELTISQDSWIFFKAEYDLANKKWLTQYTAEPSMPNRFPYNVFVCPLAFVVFDSVRITNINQIWNNGIIYNNRFA